MAKALIDGEEVDSENRIPIVNPANGEMVGDVPRLDVEKVREAVEAAYEAYSKLSSTPASDRAKALLLSANALREHAEEIAMLTALEIGRPIRSSRADALRAATIFELAASEVMRFQEGSFVQLDAYEYPAGNPNRVAFTKREPVGVVASITPFNFPAASFAHKVAPALAVGNAVVHKPSVYAPLTQIAMAKLIIPNFPKGALNVVTGESSVIGEEFIANDKVSLITFTGSEKVGLELAGKAVAAGKRVIMELGGSDAEIVFEDADMNRAVDAAIVGRFDYAGQFCNATKRILVQQKAREAFQRALKERFNALRVGDPLSEETVVGPLINREAVANMKDFLEDALNKGASLLAQLPVPDKGFYFPPTVLDGVTENMRVFSEEVFGPLMPLSYFDSEEEALEMANFTKYGLDASVFTRDFARAYRVASKLKAGSVIINDTTRLRWDNLPFGGVKRSGIGRESVRDTMIEMTENKLIVYSMRRATSLGGRKS
ncbi:MAG: aldehyde dehydrogenase family protein [Candidatus Marsarchaeota archaeon]